jgi:hypothetical protein
MKKFVLATVLLSVACSGAVATHDTPTEIGTSPVHSETRVTGALRLDLLDYPTNGGIMFALPSVSGGNGAIAVENTRYGSLCLLAVDGSADATGNTIALHMSFVERLTMCTAEIRALKYTATISEPPGSYHVLVIHEENARTDTLVRTNVTVR